MTGIEKMVANGTTREASELHMKEAGVLTGTVKECGSVLSAISEIKHRAGLSPELWDRRSEVENKRSELGAAKRAAYMASRKPKQMSRV